MIKRIDHIGIAVANIDDALKFYRDVFGLNLERTDTESSQKSVVAFMPVGSDEVELIEPIGEDGPVARFLLKRGEGIHHICFEVDDLDGELARLKAAGVQLVNDQAVVVAGGKKAAFVHPKAAHGVLIELYQNVPGEERSSLIDLNELRRRLEIETEAARAGAVQFLRAIQRGVNNSRGDNR